MGTPVSSLLPQELVIDAWDGALVGDQKGVWTVHGQPSRAGRTRALP